MRRKKKSQSRCIFDTLRIRQVDICSCYNNAARVPQLLRVDKFNEGSIRSWRGACSISHIKQWANQQSVFRTVVRGDWLRRLLQRTVDCQSNCLVSLWLVEMHVWLRHHYIISLEAILLVYHDVMWVAIGRWSARRSRKFRSTESKHLLSWRGAEHFFFFIPLPGVPSQGPLFIKWTYTTQKVNETKEEKLRTLRSFDHLRY